MLAPPALTLDLAPSLIDPAPVEDPAERWSEAYRLWIASRRSTSTRRAYRKAWDSLIVHTAKAPWEISHTDVTTWIEAQTAAGLAPDTINQRLAAVSSFYAYVAHLCT